MYCYVTIKPQSTQFGVQDLQPDLTRISTRLTAEARDRPAIISLPLLAVLNVLSRTPPLVKRRAPRTDAPLTHFGSPRGEKSGLNKKSTNVDGVRKVKGRWAPTAYHPTDAEIHGRALTAG